MKTGVRFEDVGKLNTPQMNVLLTLKDGRARVSNKTVSTPWEARRVGQATWTFIYGDLQRFGMVKYVREGDEFLAELTIEGYAYLQWYNHQAAPQVWPSVEHGRRLIEREPSPVENAPKLVLDEIQMVWCPACGKNGCKTMRSGCELCGATADEIERLEPREWDQG